MKIRKLRSTKAVAKRIRDEEWKPQADAMMKKRLSPKRDAKGHFVKKVKYQFGSGSTPVFLGPFSKIAPKKVVNTTSTFWSEEGDKIYKRTRS